MRLRLLVLPTIVTAVAALGAVVPATAQHAAAPDCTYTPKLPKRVVVSKPTVNFHTPVKISGGKKCATLFDASEELTHSSDTYHLNWTQDSHTSSNSIFPVTVVPGIYRTHAPSCSASSDQMNLSCKVVPGKTVIKFGQKAHFSASRLTGAKHDKVQFTAKATRYDQTETKYVTTKVAIQRQRHNGKWKTVHSEVAHGKRGYVWTHTERKTAVYRAVSSQTATSFSATSRTIKV